MFERDITLTGKHATYVKYFRDDAKLYARYVDVYMNGAIFGLLHNRRAEKDSGDATANILADTLQRERNKCVLLYRLVMLLDETSNLDVQERINRAFRDDADDAAPGKLVANMELFNSYVRGGIEEMYEQFIDGHGVTADEYLDRAMDVMETFKDELDDVDFSDKLESLMQG
ncbi:hypothetical protein ACTQ40_00190 [Collinsella sp. Sow4_D11]|uniref:hypothetical protein n=1 Tax=Collinsella sp. Sow4_D11 TaxID=3438775 RepID=UPI003F8FE4CC